MARTWSGGPGSSLPDLEPVNWRRLGVVGVCLLAAVVLVMVGGPAAVASYRHARHVVELHGDPVMAPWLPLTTDGMLLAALVVMWVRRVLGHDIGRGPWFAFGLGLAATLYANIVAAGPGVAGFLVAVWPPVCLAVTLELLALLVVYAQRGPGRPDEQREDLTDHTDDTRPADTAEAIEQPAAELGAIHAAPIAVDLAQIPAPPEWLEAPVPGDEQTWTIAGPDRTDPADGWDVPLPDEAYADDIRHRTEPNGPTDADRIEADDDTVRAWIREQPTVPSRYAVTQRYRMGPGRARRLLDERTAELEAVGS